MVRAQPDARVHPLCACEGRASTSRAESNDVMRCRNRPSIAVTGSLSNTSTMPCVSEVQNIELGGGTSCVATVGWRRRAWKLRRALLLRVSTVRNCLGQRRDRVLYEVSSGWYVLENSRRCARVVEGDDLDGTLELGRPSLARNFLEISPPPRVSTVSLSLPIHLHLRLHGLLANTLLLSSPPKVYRKQTNMAGKAVG